MNPDSKIRLLFAIAVTLCCTGSLADKARASTNVASRFDRAIVKEPTYQSAPKYCILTLGSSSDTKVWMIEDGKRLFVDRNANGDMTDDGPPIQPGKVRNLGDGHRDFEYSLDAITPSNGSRHTNFVLRRWNYGEAEDSYGLSLSVNGQMPMYAGWFGTFWSTNRETAPIVHFGGPFTPKLLRACVSLIPDQARAPNPGSASTHYLLRWCQSCISNGRLPVAARHCGSLTN